MLYRGLIMELLIWDLVLCLQRRCRIFHVCRSLITNYRFVRSLVVRHGYLQTPPSSRTPFLLLKFSTSTRMAGVFVVFSAFVSRFFSHSFMGRVDVSSCFKTYTEQLVCAKGDKKVHLYTVRFGELFVTTDVKVWRKWAPT
ncbi:unnamed protein product [Hapterophycus canaliculatus]